MKDFENAIEWLCDCGIIRKVDKVNDVKILLKEYKNNEVIENVPLYLITMI